jgi:hypothetical protein
MDLRKACRLTVSFRYTKRSVREAGRPRPAKRARRPFSILVVETWLNYVSKERVRMAKESFGRNKPHRNVGKR